MKLVYLGLVMLCTLTLVCTAAGTPSTDPQSKPVTEQSSQISEGQVSSPAPTTSDQSSTILSREEAESMRVQGDSLLARSDVGEITVGSIANDELIYILVVVLLVVVILAVAL